MVPHYLYFYCYYPLPLECHNAWDSAKVTSIFLQYLQAVFFSWMRHSTSPPVKHTVSAGGCSSNNTSLSALPSTLHPHVYVAWWHLRILHKINILSGKTRDIKDTAADLGVLHTAIRRAFHCHRYGVGWRRFCVSEALIRIIICISLFEDYYLANWREERVS